jgi:hypothetical protein
MMNSAKVRDHMEVMGSCGNHVGTVDHMEGNSIKLTRSDPMAEGQHHYIPLDWVESIESVVRLNKSCDDVHKEWQLAPLGTTV